ncbi:MAG TPA: diguanylate cyclase [Burkholderiaceae bacterium]|jgi:diguanylate cyclase (GGDEF)-like protein|nr:diguanylate cyclase [Burkholderiaceae bacterium]
MSDSGAPLPAELASTPLLEGLLALLQVQGVMLSVKDGESGRYLWANEAWCRLLGTEPARLVGATDLELLPLGDATAVRSGDQRVLGSGGVAVGEQRLERQGQRQDLRTLRCLLPASKGGSAESVGAGRAPSTRVLSLWWDDSTSRRQAAQLQQALGQIERQHAAAEQLRRQHAEGLDRPSELFRREHFEEHLRREVALSLREQREFALVLLAVDRSDGLRERHGEAGLKRVAETVGQLMRSNTRAMDVLAQLGDDRFAILLSGVGLATAHNRMEQLRRACTGHLVVLGGQAFHFEMSVGVASFPHTAETLEELSQAAIRALQDARRRGGNRVALATIRFAGVPAQA